MKNHRCDSTIETLNDKYTKNSPTTQNYQPLIHWLTCPIQYLIMMKLWLSIRNLPNNPNHYRFIPGNTLHIRHYNSILISNSYLPRRKLRMSDPIYTRKWSINIFYLLIPSCRTRDILWILHIYRNMKYWSCPTLRSDSNRIHRLCPSMRTNVILRSNSHYKLTLSNPIHWDYTSRMDLRRILSR